MLREARTRLSKVSSTLMSMSPLCVQDLPARAVALTASYRKQRTRERLVMGSLVIAMFVSASWQAYSVQSGGNNSLTLVTMAFAMGVCMTYDRSRFLLMSDRGVEITAWRDLEDRWISEAEADQIAEIATRRRWVAGYVDAVLKRAGRIDRDVYQCLQQFDAISTDIERLSATTSSDRVRAGISAGTLTLAPVHNRG